MKINCFLVLSFLLTISVQAQFDSSKKKVNISAKPDKISPKKSPITSENTTSNFPSIKFESQYLNKNEDKLLKQISNVPKIGEAKEKAPYELKNSSEIYTDIVKKKMKTEGLTQDIVNSDMYLGDFTVFTNNLDFNCRDYGTVDGDYVRVWVNDELVVREIELESGFKNYNLLLKEGANTIKIEALNTGEYFPNTGQFVFYDGNGRIVTDQKWGLNTSFYAIIKITKLKGLTTFEEDKKK